MRQSAALLQTAAVLGPTRLMMGAVVPWRSAVDFWTTRPGCTVYGQSARPSGRGATEHRYPVDKMIHFASRKNPPKWARRSAMDCCIKEMRQSGSCGLPNILRARSGGAR
jgi:hypothetical protein